MKRTNKHIAKRLATIGLASAMMVGGIAYTPINEIQVQAAIPDNYQEYLHIGDVLEPGKSYYFEQADNVYTDDFYGVFINFEGVSRNDSNITNLESVNRWDARNIPIYNEDGTIFSNTSHIITIKHSENFYDENDEPYLRIYNYLYDYEIEEEEDNSFCKLKLLGVEEVDSEGQIIESKGIKPFYEYDEVLDDYVFYYIISNNYDEEMKDIDEKEKEVIAYNHPHSYALNINTPLSLDDGTLVEKWIFSDMKDGEMILTPVFFEKKAPVLDSIEATYEDGEYFVGDKVDASKVKVVASYKDKEDGTITKQEVSDFSIDKDTFDVVGNNEIVVTYEGKTAVVNVEATRKEVLKGDLDGDGTINSTDAVAMQKYLAGNVMDGFIKEAADLDGDGEVTTTDAVLLMKYLAGYEVDFSK